MIKEMVIPLSLSDGLLLFIFSYINGVNNLSFNDFFSRSTSLLMCQCRDYPELCAFNIVNIF